MTGYLTHVAAQEHIHELRRQAEAARATRLPESKRARRFDLGFVGRFGRPRGRIGPVATQTR
jgi:hypothetical protein